MFQGTDIIVFPEYGLTTTAIANNKEEAEPFSSIIPVVTDTPYNPSMSVLHIGSEVTIYIYLLILFPLFFCSLHR